VNAVPAVIGRSQERERSRQLGAGSVDAVANGSAVLGAVGQHASDRARGDIEDIVHRPAAVGEARGISGQEAEPLLGAKWRRGDAGVEPQQVGDGTGVIGAAPGTDGSHVLDQRQQIGARRRRYGDADAGKDLGQQRIEEEAGELSVVDGSVHAESRRDEGGGRSVLFVQMDPVDLRCATHGFEFRPRTRICQSHPRCLRPMGSSEDSQRRR